MPATQKKSLVQLRAPVDNLYHRSSFDQMDATDQKVTIASAGQSIGLSLLYRGHAIAS
jgi:hypothetical protein